MHPDRITAARELKPTIPLIGNHGIVARDELILAFDLSPPP